MAPLTLHRLRARPRSPGSAGGSCTAFGEPWHRNGPSAQPKGLRRNAKYERPRVTTAVAPKMVCSTLPRCWARWAIRSLPLVARRCPRSTLAQKHEGVWSRGTARALVAQPAAAAQRSGSPWRAGALSRARRGKRALTPCSSCPSPPLPPFAGRRRCRRWRSPGRIGRRRPRTRAHRRGAAQGRPRKKGRQNHALVCTQTHARSQKARGGAGLRRRAHAARNAPRAGKPHTCVARDGVGGARRAWEGAKPRGP